MLTFPAPPPPPPGPRPARDPHRRAAIVHPLSPLPAGNAPPRASLPRQQPATHLVCSCPASFWPRGPALPSRPSLPPAEPVPLAAASADAVDRPAGIGMLPRGVAALHALWQVPTRCGRVPRAVAGSLGLLRPARGHLTCPVRRLRRAGRPRQRLDARCVAGGQVVTRNVSGRRVVGQRRLGAHERQVKQGLQAGQRHVVPPGSSFPPASRGGGGAPRDGSFLAPSQRGGPPPPHTHSKARQGSQPAIR